MATMQRAMLRAGVELKYSEGFNPHPYMSVALPLPVGCESICELMDVSIQDTAFVNGLPESVNAMLPDGIEILEVYIPAGKFNAIGFVGIAGLLHYDRGLPPNAAQRLAERFAADSIIISKRTKRGISDIDIAPFVKDVIFTGEHEIAVTAKISAQNPSLNTDDILGALAGDFLMLAPDYATFRRTGVLDAEMKDFR